MSHKIKLSLKDSSKSLESLPNQKISISLGKKNKIKPKTSIKSSNEKKTLIPKSNKPVTYDQHLYKQFKNSFFSKIDLHGLTVDEAYETLNQYIKRNFNQNKLYHIIVTGLGNKSNGSDFFTGKIRKHFPFWLETEEFQKYIKSYSPCKIHHGGLGAFYVKLKTKE